RSRPSALPGLTRSQHSANLVRKLRTLFATSDAGPVASAGLRGRGRGRASGARGRRSSPGAAECEGPSPGGDAVTAVTTRPPATRTAPRALGCGIAAPAVLVVVDLVHALARPGYDPLRHWVSHLALGSFGWVGTATLLATALLLGGYALGLRRA